MLQHRIYHNVECVFFKNCIIILALQRSNFPRNTNSHFHEILHFLDSVHFTLLLVKFMSRTSAVSKSIWFEHFTVSFVFDLFQLHQRTTFIEKVFKSLIFSTIETQNSFQLLTSIRVQLLSRKWMILFIQQECVAL